MTIVYKKTLKGVEEVALRSSGLQLRMRAYLILVDGMKSDDDIQMINPSLPEVVMVLAALSDEGYIEALGQQASRANFQQTVQQKPQHSQQSNNTASFATTTSSANSSSFLEARDAMTRDIMQLLGKDAEMVVSKIQRCENSMDLFAMMMGLKKIIGMYASNDKAEQFAQKFSYISTL